MHCDDMCRDRLSGLNKFKRLVVALVSLAMLLDFANDSLSAEDENERPFGLSKRTPWTTSRLVGSPDPPLLYIAKKAFTEIDWRRPLYAKREPDGKHLFVIEQGGEKNRPSKLFRIVDRIDASEKHETV